LKVEEGRGKKRKKGWGKGEEEVQLL